MAEAVKMAPDALSSLDGLRARSDSTSSTASQGSKGKLLLRQRLSQLLMCVEDLSSDDEANEEVSRTLDEAFQLCGRFSPKDAFRLTHGHTHTHIFWAVWKILPQEHRQVYAHTHRFCSVLLT